MKVTRSRLRYTLYTEFHSNLSIGLEARYSIPTLRSLHSLFGGKGIKSNLIFDKQLYAFVLSSSLTLINTIDQSFSRETNSRSANQNIVMYRQRLGKRVPEAGALNIRTSIARQQSYNQCRAEQSRAEQSGAEQSSSLLPATSQHGHSWHLAPLRPMAIYLFSVETFFFFFRCSSFDKREGLGFFLQLVFPYDTNSTRGHIEVGDIYILYIFTKHKLTLSSTIYRDICQCRIVQQLMPQLT
jgi:hypothetical protein